MAEMDLIKKESKILYIDDDVMSLKIFQSCFADKYEIYLAETEMEVFKVLREYEIEVFVADQYMPVIDGTDLISKVKKEFPDVVCIMLTGQSSKSLLLKAINEVNVFWFLEKPLDKFDGNQAIKRAVETYRNNKENIRLNSELKAALEKIFKVEQLKTDFLMNLSHEIRTPLNGIIGFGQLLAEDLIENQQVQKYLKILNDSSSNLIHVVDDIITASKIHSDKVRQKTSIFNIEKLFQIINDQFEETISDKNLNTRIVLDKNLKELNIKTDEGILYEVFTQLIKNAIKYTLKGTIEFGLFDYDKQIFCVKDTGIGIDEDEKKEIFEYFKQGKQTKYARQFGGLGLGLSIAKGLLDIVGGTIWFESEKNRGSVFYFTFPFNKSESNLADESFEVLKSNNLKRFSNN
jgi:signal transduction histidine kinase